MKNAKNSLLVFFLTVPALAQTNGTFVITSSNTVTPSSPTTTIGIWATWSDPGGELIFSLSNYDLSAAEGVFSNPVDVLQGPLSSAGVVAGNTVSGATNGQLLLRIRPSFPPTNPILLATYDWTTLNFTARTVNLQTSNTSTFILGDWRTGGFIELYPGKFTPGSGVIIVEGNCYADCDGSGMLDLFDFLCFQNSFVNGEPYACDCDTTTGTNPPVCDIFDFLCFQNAFVTGCP